MNWPPIINMVAAMALAALLPNAEHPIAVLLGWVGIGCAIFISYMLGYIDAAKGGADCPHAPRLPFREAGDPPPTGGERAVLIVICIAWAACAAITLGVMLRACGGELQRLPQPLPVKTVIATAEQCFAEGDAVTLYLSDLDALPVDTVRAAGGYVLITGA